MQTRTPEYFMDVYASSPENYVWETVEEFHEKYNPSTTPELIAKRASIQDKLNVWGARAHQGLVPDRILRG